MATFKLLTEGNPKTEKGEKFGYWTFILHLAPAKLSGFQVCPMATEGCRAACLNTAGRGGMMPGIPRLTLDDVEAGKLNNIQKARIRKTRYFFENREAFMHDLCADIVKAIRTAKKSGFTPVFRLNGTSDIRFEAVPVDGARNVMELFYDVQFYDYTKIPNRKNIPANYHLTFSLAETNELSAFSAIDNGMNVAVVFRDKQTIASKPSYLGKPIYNGDESDLRFLDPPGHIVALYAKGNAKKDQSGFVKL